MQGVATCKAGQLLQRPENLRIFLHVHFSYTDYVSISVVVVFPCTHLESGITKVCSSSKGVVLYWSAFGHAAYLIM
jgi:hypothetical protein